MLWARMILALLFEKEVNQLQLWILCLGIGIDMFMMDQDWDWYSNQLLDQIGAPLMYGGVM
jgi:hypothetical protein